MKVLHYFLCLELILVLVCSTEIKEPGAILTPQESIQDFQVETGFEVKNVLAEPLVEDPVSLNFDEEGRMWIVEMRGYMLDMDAAGENLPLGRIKVFEDKNDNGDFETSSIFLDSLIMPRSVAVVKGGILLVEPPNLFFVENIKGKAGKKKIIDSTFALEGNVEHRANGLTWNVDNWFYNAKSDKRVGFVNGVWKVEPTFFRGQWGISHDDIGRLYSNNNSVTLMIDNFLPNSFGTNVNHTLVSKDVRDVRLVDGKVFPRRPTPGVNRGYQKGVLDTQKKLINTTASSSPLVYRGNNFPKEYYGSVFVAEPSGNLIKRIKITDDGTNHLAGEFANPEKEFLTATDELFRPVSLYDSPDGSLFMIDMHRGIIQHTTYLTPYLRNYSDSLKLDRIHNLGRIYRIKWKQTAIGKNPHLGKASSNELVKNLSHPNGWVRDMSQRLLVDRGDKGVSESLKSLALTSENPATRIHALWTLQGLGDTTPTWIGTAAQKSNSPYVYQTCLKLLSDFPNDQRALVALVSLRKTGDKAAEVQFINSLGAFNQTFWASTQPLLVDVVSKNANDERITDAVMMGLAGKEKEFLNNNRSVSSESTFSKALKGAIAKSEQPKEIVLSHLTVVEQDLVNSGRRSYGTICSGCHGREGEGTKGLAPPLAGSEWVTHANEQIVTRIVLDGIAGPIHVKGQLYGPPDYLAAMPGLRDAIEYNNGTIAAVLSYIRNSFGNKGSVITVEEVGAVRKQTQAHKQSYSESELLEIKN